MEQLFGASVSQSEQVSGGNAEFSAVERQDESATGHRIRIGCRVRPVDEHDVRRRAQSVARRTGGGRSSLFPSRTRQGRQQVHSEVSQMPQGLERTVSVVFTKTAHVASVVCHGRGDDQAWTPRAIDHGVVTGKVLLTPSEALSLTGQSLPSPTTSAVPHWVVLLFPQENRQRSKVGAADDTVAIDSARVNWMQRVFPVLANQQKFQPLFQTDHQSFFEVFRRATNNIGIYAVPYQMRHSGPSLDLVQGIRDITSCRKRGRWATMTSLKRYEKHGRLNDTWRLLSPGTQAYCLTCKHDAEGYILAGETCPLPPRLVE